MSDIWVIADPGLGREDVAVRRGHVSAQAMEEALRSAWAECVSPGQEVYVVGDLGVSNEQFELWMAKLPGRKIRICSDPVADVGSDAFWFDVRQNTTILVEGLWGSQGFSFYGESEDDVALLWGPEDGDTDTQINISLDEWGMTPVSMTKVGSYWSHLEEGSASPD